MVRELFYEICHQTVFVQSTFLVTGVESSAKCLEIL